MDNPQASPPDPPVQPEVVRRAVPSAAAVARVAPHPGRLGRWMNWLGWIGCLVCLFIILGLYTRHREYFDTTGGAQEQYHSRSKSARDKVAIINISGVIGTGEEAKRQIDCVREDDRVKAIVLRIDSPGGTITGSDYLYHHLCELKQEREIPLVVSMGSVAASGGYYIAMAVGDQPRSIFAEPTTTTGSIGVIVPHYDLSGLMERLDIKDDSIASHPRKRLLSMTKPLSADDREILEDYMEEAFDRFKEIVRQGRPAFRGKEGELEELATGQIFSAQQARQHGLVDEIGFLEAAIDRAAELAGFEPQEVRVVQYRSPLQLIDLLLAARSSHARHAGLESMARIRCPARVLPDECATPVGQSAVTTRRSRAVVRPAPSARPGFAGHDGWTVGLPVSSRRSPKDLPADRHETRDHRGGRGPIRRVAAAAQTLGGVQIRCPASAGATDSESTGAEVRATSNRVASAPGTPVLPVVSPRRKTAAVPRH